MKQLMDILLINNTPERLRIQLLDEGSLAMFQSGRADMFLIRKIIGSLCKSNC